MLAQPLRGKDLVRSPRPDVSRNPTRGQICPAGASGRFDYAQASLKQTKTLLAAAIGAIQPCVTAEPVVWVLEIYSYGGPTGTKCSAMAARTIFRRLVADIIHVRSRFAPRGKRQKELVNRFLTSERDAQSTWR